MTIIGDGTADCQAIVTRGHRISVHAILEGLLDGSHSPDRLFEFLFGVLIGLDNRLYSDYGILGGIPRKEKINADEICRSQPKRTEVLGSHESDRRRVSASIACI